MTSQFMQLDGQDPEGKTVAGRCPHCAHQATLTCTSHLELAGTRETNREPTVVRYLMTLKCHWCQKESVFLRIADFEWHRINSNRHVEGITTKGLEQVWPKKTPRELAPEAPETVREVFAEGALAEAASAYRLAGIGYRAAVEQIVKERGTSGKNLRDRITSLKDLGASQEIVDAFHEARFVGNDAAHDALAYSAEEIADIAELIHEAVLVLYVQPAQRAKMAAQRAARRSAAKQPSV
ncbi:DUF4145 domain-containing protein [Streptomyces sp. CS014]|uniref:DUF4145 domain-containing protein n=1 Tax=Streptomyces sp. CS014 TaxID=2162707 RepID=UPI0013A56B69|nr:DUF4145 domain-containing protein [Streptomyces sp. CS014]